MIGSLPMVFLIGLSLEPVYSSMSVVLLVSVFFPFCLSFVSVVPFGLSDVASVRAQV